MTTHPPPSRWHAILPRLSMILGLPGIALIVGAYFVYTRPYVVPRGTEIFTMAAGRWAWNTQRDGCSREWHRITFSPDRTVMYITSSEPYKGADGLLDSVAVYDLQESTRSSIRGAIRGETRLTDDGVPVVWDLVLRGPDRYAWHRTDWVRGSLTREIRRCPVASAPPRSVAFTFDDLPVSRFVSVADNEAVTARLLGHLRAARIPAIGFVNERKLETPPAASARLTALLQAWLDAGADLGNHGYAHRRFWDYPLPEVQADVLRGERETKRLMAPRGRRPRYYRHTTLNTGPDLATKQAFERFLADHGYQVAPVTIDNDDYLYALAYDHARARADSAAMARLGQDYIRYMEEVFVFYESLSVSLLGREPAQVLLLHANALNSDYVDDLAAMIAARGYRFVSLDEALADPAYQLEDRYTGPRGISWLQRWAITQGKPPGEQPEIPQWVRAATRN